jgi:hypothetical protein
LAGGWDALQAANAAQTSPIDIERMAELLTADLKTYARGNARRQHGEAVVSARRERLPSRPAQRLAAGRAPTCRRGSCGKVC